ncbi:hypothetical protein GCM10007426_33040 [Alloalcanivorax dieselolei]|uniref:hypothetical protein n=1 Tax=Alloalcanivorax dieselolei TaxID=285091 RepID=UPI0005A07445|nr:hypothetical protein [Alloalcanivorax dieselolei]GGK01383.1 hypothetical protein GCM10007426_33040 [Alloalcanivorax dieselolei]
MILISEEGKSLVKIERWQEVLERPGYVETINADKVKLKSIIGRYHIETKEPCGISSCRTPHSKGYLVVCEGGVETNIGNKCGQRIFGVEFKELETTFKKDTNAQRFRENIDKKQNEITKRVIEEISKLRDGEGKAEYLYERVNSYLTRLFDEKISSALIQRAKRKDPFLYEEILLTSKEREVAQELGGNTSTKREMVGVIQGLSAVAEYKTMRRYVLHDLGQDLEAFKSLKSELLSYEELRKWNRWASQFEKKINETKRIMSECNRFLGRSNIDFVRENKVLL